jgi:hypothetical protein
MCSCITVIRQSEHRSKKERYCGLSEHVGEVDFPRGKLSFSEIKSLVIYQRNKRKIMPGDIYVSQFNKYEGETYTWLAKKDIYNLLCKHDLFPCVC